MQTIVRNYTVTTSLISITTAAQSADVAVDLVLKFENAPPSALVSVYQDDPVPHVSAKYGAPMGRMSNALDHDTLETKGMWRAERLDLDEGYDAGGAYWGMRMNGEALYSVQDGMGNIAFVDARTNAEALQKAAA